MAGFEVSTEGKTVRASIALKRVPPGKQVYAYLRYHDGRRTYSHYICNAGKPSRRVALRSAWQRARQTDLDDPNDGEWVIPE
jgi:hypothetical protein